MSGWRVSGVTFYPHLLGHGVSSMTWCRVLSGHLHWQVPSIPCGPRLILGPVGSNSLWFLRIMKNVTSIDIFIYTEWHLSLDMKTKVVQHVESDWMRDWKSVRVRKSESEIARESEKVWGWVLSIEMKTKVVQNVKSDWMRDWMRVRKSEIVRESEGVIWFPAFVWHSEILL